VSAHVRDAKPVGPRWCKCVTVHHPQQLPDEAEGHHRWPLAYGGPDIPENMDWLCSTTHTKVHNLWRHYARAGGRPDWAILRRYSRFVRDNVADGWGQVMLARRVPEVRAMILADDPQTMEG
jgi:hypothetical protein